MIDWSSNQTRLAFQEIQSYTEMYGRGSRVVRWAYAYRRLRNRVYYGLQQQWAGFLSRPKLDPGKLHVLLHLRGGLGDACALWVVIRALRKQLPNAVFYYYTDSPNAMRLLVVPDAQNMILPPGRIPYRRAYDMACELCLSFKTVYVKQARIAELAPQFMSTLQTSLKRQQELSFFLSDNYLLDDALGRFLYRQQAGRLEALHYLSALDFDPQETDTLPAKITGKEISRYGLKAPYITVHSGINASFDIGMKIPLKCWPTPAWSAFLELFKKRFPHIQIVQVGGKNSPRLDKADICLLGETPIEDVPAILQHARLHIDGESGLVQLTRWLNTKSVVLFGPTAPCLFSLAKNINLSEPVCGHCMWLSGPVWHTQCALGHPACLNITQITPQTVLEAVSKELQ
ncbi:MAG: glycosyltransferase family 9 protein [Elusimicrobiaceae bacterium]|nr:glycosyltransferase family 9 protein [Elusimicrobiaceae bacterium]